jgi:hypothetical protein
MRWAAGHDRESNARRLGSPRARLTVWPIEAPQAKDAAADLDRLAHPYIA